MAKLSTSDLLDAFKEMTLIELSEFLTHCQRYKQLTLEDRIKAQLRARLLHLPAEFDHSYEGMLPRF